MKNWIKEKKNVLILLTLYVIFIFVGVKYRLGINDEPTLTDIVRSTLFMLSSIYFLPTAIHLFFKEKLLARWFVYSLIFSLPIVYITSYTALHPAHGGIVGDELILLPIGALTVLLFVTTPFFLHFQTKRIRNKV